ncbi:MAG: YraN family protein [Pirellulales bacterium]|nr:YraN family protein [Pirellulales bacterium]
MKSGLAERRRRETLGRKAERRAAFWLRLKGYRSLGARVRTPFGEIDLVARRGNVIAFIEVKARTSERDALQAVTPRQRQRIQSAALWWQARQPDLAGNSMRFDIVAVMPGRLPRHIPDAWRADTP